MDPRFIIYVIFVWASVGHAQIDDSDDKNRSFQRDQCDYAFEMIKSDLDDNTGLKDAMCQAPFDIECVNQVLGFAGRFADDLEKTKYPRGLGFGNGCMLPDPNCEESVTGVLKMLNETTKNCVCVFFHALCDAEFPPECEKDVLGLIQGYRNRKLDATLLPKGNTDKQPASIPAAFGEECQWNNPTGFRPLDAQGMMDLQTGMGRWESMRTQFDSDHRIVGLFNTTEQELRIPAEPLVDVKSDAKNVTNGVMKCSSFLIGVWAIVMAMFGVGYFL